jgi:trigger factor
MTAKLESLEKNIAKITVTVDAETFDKALVKAFKKNKSRYTVPGFRRGHATQRMIEQIYGKGVFYEDAMNDSINETYPGAIDELNLEVVSRPTVDVSQVEAGKELIYTAEVAVKPEVTLGEYKGVEVKKAEATVTDEDVEKKLQLEQANNARLIHVTDRDIQDGDVVRIDFDGKVDGVRFDGGKAEDYELTIGSHAFIEGFEEKLIGHNKDEEFDIDVVFPEDYHADALAGKPAVFTIKVNEISEKILPELDDDFASEVSEFDTLDEYKAQIRNDLLEEKNKSAVIENENNVLAKVVENATMDIPAAMIEAEAEQMANDYAYRMQMQGMPFDKYLELSGMTFENIVEQFKSQAEHNIKIRLTVEAVVKAEDIKASDEAVEAEIAKMAESYKMEVDKLNEYMGEQGLENLKSRIAFQEAIDSLVEWAKLV